MEKVTRRDRVLQIEIVERFHEEIRRKVSESDPKWSHATLWQLRVHASTCELCGGLSLMGPRKWHVFTSFEKLRISRKN